MPDSLTTNASQGRSYGRFVFFAAIPLWLYVLDGFVSTPAWIVLAVLGPALFCGGIYLALGSLRLVFESVWYVGAFGLGLLMVVGAAATLAPGAPDQFLMTSASGWGVLERRAELLDDAIQAGDVGLAARIARPGLGDPAARDAFGTPLLHLARDPEMLTALLENGLDPDARDADGRTLLMRSAGLETTRSLLEAGADPNARTALGTSVLMLRGDDEIAITELLLQAGADVHAVDNSGRTVADLVRGPGRALLERYAGGRPLRESGSVSLRGRSDWLEQATGLPMVAESAAVSLEPRPLRPGRTGTVTIRLANASGEDRLLELRAELNEAVLFVGASHDGAVEKRGRPGSTSTVRWPLLALPAGSRGRLEMQVVATADAAVVGPPPGDLSVDVRVVDLPQRSEQVLSVYVPREPPGTTAEPWTARALVPLMLPVILAAAVWLVVRGARRGPGASARRFRAGRTAAAAGALICTVVAFSMLWSMAEPFLRFEAASCEVLDQRVMSVQVRTSARASTRQRTTYGVPLAAVRIAHGGEPLIATGFAVGSATRSVQELRNVPIGSETTCWIDPDDPYRFTLVRSQSLQGVVGLGMLGLIALVLGTIALRLGTGSRTQGSDANSEEPR